MELSRVDGLLSLSADFSIDNDDGFLDKIDIFGFFDIDGSVTFSVRPVIDSVNHILSISELEFDTDSNNILADSLVTIAKLKPIRDMIRETLRYEYAGEIDKLKTLIGKEINRDLGHGINILGEVDSIKLGEIIIQNESLSLPVFLSGNARILVGLTQIVN